MKNYSCFSRLLLLFFCSSMLLACSVQLVSDYDEQIDASLTDLNTDLVAFVNKMTAAAGTPSGTYDTNKDFYITEEAKVQTIEVRAQAYQVLNSCPSTEVIKFAVAHGGSTALLPEGPLPQGDCGVVLIGLIGKGFADLETFHRAQGSKGIPMSARDPILVGGLGSLIKSAIIVEIAEKTNKTPGAS
jgi:hypothetical protein